MSGNNGDLLAAQIEKLQESLPGLDMGLEDRIVDSVFRDVWAIVREWREARVPAGAAVCVAQSQLKIARLAVVNGPAHYALRRANHEMLQALGDEHDPDGQ